MSLLYATAREVINNSFHISVFRFQFVNACLIAKIETEEANARGAYLLIK